MLYNIDCTCVSCVLPTFNEEEEEEEEEDASNPLPNGTLAPVDVPSGSARV